MLMEIKQFAGMKLAKALIFTVLASGMAQAESTLEKIKAKGEIRIGFANEAPFAYATPSGELTGIDIEVLRQLLAEIGVKEIDAGLTTFGGLIPGLKAGRFDLVTSAIYIRPDRCAQVAFGEPLYLQGDGIAVKAGNPKKIHGYEDVAKDPEIKIAVTAGATAIAENAKAMGVKDSQIVQIPDDISGYAAIKADRVDGFASTTLLIETQLRTANDPAFERASPFTQPVVEGKPRFALTSFAVRPEDSDLLAELNKRLLELRSKPEYLTLMQKHGLTADDAVPEGMTTASACQ